MHCFQLLAVLLAAVAISEAKKECGTPKIEPKLPGGANRIVGGSDAVPHSYPWQAHLSIEIGSSAGSCGGALLPGKSGTSSAFVVTAAHCVQQGSQVVSPGKITVTLGAHNIEAQEASAQKIKVKKVHMNGYDVRSLHNDIAVLELEREVAYSTEISPICLPKKDDKLPKTCYVTGWGATSKNGATSKTLKQVNVDIFQDSKCNLPKFDSTKQFCAGSETGDRDSCNGDSGGPLVCKDKKTFTLMGIVSLGKGCGDSKHPGFYTKVTSQFVPENHSTPDYEVTAYAERACYLTEEERELLIKIRKRKAELLEEIESEIIVLLVTGLVQMGHGFCLNLNSLLTQQLKAFKRIVRLFFAAILRNCLFVVAFNNWLNAAFYVSVYLYVLQQIRTEMMEVNSEIETLDMIDEERASSKTKQLAIGKKKFNMNAKKGIEFLIEHGLIGESAESVAEFLYRSEGLSKAVIGDYLGDRDEFNIKVLGKFVDLQDFSGLSLVEALRHFLWSFRLPGEAQKIDRMMDSFAKRYCTMNPGIFRTTGEEEIENLWNACYVVSFAIIMLNTSLHNPNVKEKVTLEQFVLRTRDVDVGQDIPKELLASFYECIRAEPFKIPEDSGKEFMHTFFNPDREGWLWKQGGRYKSWKRRWFILSDNCLYYFENKTEKEPRGIIPLENVQIREVQDKTRAHCFEIYSTNSNFIKACKTDSEGKVIEGKHTTYRMAASSAEEKQSWIRAFESSINQDPFPDLFQIRKRKVGNNN
ncbi:Cytohesin-3 [Trichinella pseudospiralis]|uniref:Cytohesin-3 n=1 Tax=Trichinella pseudospiralis TaxID=6337 RepID=A0A0V1FR09_TRIPS|nr:Cytohesin-3 [Trichinella pseudospiralis]